MFTNIFNKNIIFIIYYCTCLVYLYLLGCIYSFIIFNQLPFYIFISIIPYIVSKFPCRFYIPKLFLTSTLIRLIKNLKIPLVSHRFHRPFQIILRHAYPAYPSKMLHEYFGFCKACFYSIN